MFLCTSIIILLQGLCLSFFFLWAPAKVTHLYGLFLPLFIFALCVVFQGFSLLDSSIPWPVTPISSTLPMLSPSPLIILLPNWFLLGCMFNPTSVRPRFYLTFLLGLSPRPSFVSPLVASGSLRSPLIMPLSFHFFGKRF